MRIGVILSRLTSWLFTLWLAAAQHVRQQFFSRLRMVTQFVLIEKFSTLSRLPSVGYKDTTLKKKEVLVLLSLALHLCANNRLALSLSKRHSRTLGCTTQNIGAGLRYLPFFLVSNHDAGNENGLETFVSLVSLRF